MRFRRIAILVLMSEFIFTIHPAPARAQSAQSSNQQTARQQDAQAGWQRFSQPVSQANPQALMNRINEERTARGVPNLVWNDQLAASALTHGRRIVGEGHLSHQLAGEADLSERIHATGLRFDTAGENLAIAGSVEQIHGALMNSPPHRANILDQDYNSVGIAIIPRGRDLYAVENFARVYPTYSEGEFRDELISTFDRARKARRNFPVEIRPDSRLTEAACSQTSDTQAVLRNQPGARSLVIFTSSSPDMMPQDMLDAAADPNLSRINLGVCYRPGKVQGNASFRVVAAFYPGIHN
jgi:uncharacterized protein YkwD